MSNVRKNYIYNVIYQLLAVILPLITSPYISRILQAEGLGIYSYTFSIVQYFILFSMLGIKNYGVRSIARVKDDKEQLSKTFWEIYAIQLFLSITVIIAYAIYIGFISNEYFNINILQFFIVLSALFDVSWFFFGIEKFKITVSRNIVIRIISVILIFLFIKDKTNLPLYTLIMSISTLINQILLWPFVRKEVKYRKVNLATVKKHIKPIIALFVPVIAVSFYIYMDKIMLGYLSTMEEVGLYYSAEKIVNIPFGFILAFGTVMLPRMSYLFEKKDTRRIKNNIEKSMEFNMFLSSAMTFGIAGVANVFAPWFFGKGFEAVSLLIIAIAPIIIIKSWANVIRNQYLIPKNMDTKFSLSVISGAITNVMLNLLLIPRYGALGAIIATVFAELIVCIIQTIFAYRDLEIYKYIINSLRYFFAGIVMYLSIFWIGNIISNPITVLIIQVSIGSTIFLCISFFLHPKKTEILKFIKNKIKGKRRKYGN